jgi:hypothetical protein
MDADMHECGYVQMRIRIRVGAGTEMRGCGYGNPRMRIQICTGADTDMRGCGYGYAGT